MMETSEVGNGSQPRHGALFSAADVAPHAGKEFAAQVKSVHLGLFG
jgi:hypothetical protein